MDLTDNSILENLSTDSWSTTKKSLNSANYYLCIFVSVTLNLDSIFEAWILINELGNC